MQTLLFSNRIVLSVGVDLKYPSSPIIPALPPITLYNSQVYTTHGSRKETQNVVSCMPRLANSRLPIINTFMTSQLYVSHRECKAFSSLLCIRIFTLWHSRSEECLITCHHKPGHHRYVHFNFIPWLWLFFGEQGKHDFSSFSDPVDISQYWSCDLQHRSHDSRGLQCHGSSRGYHIWDQSELTHPKHQCQFHFLHNFSGGIWVEAQNQVTNDWQCPSSNPPNPPPPPSSPSHLLPNDHKSYRHCPWRGHHHGRRGARLLKTTRGSTIVRTQDQRRQNWCVNLLEFIVPHSVS